MNIFDTYLKTRFKFNNCTEPIYFRRVNREINDYLEKNNYKTYTILTPYNPHPHLLSDMQNEKAYNHLKDILDNNLYMYFEGFGLDNDNPEYKEKSFMIFDIPIDISMTLAEKYQQLAIGLGSLDNKLSLVILR